MAAIDALCPTCTGVPDVNGGAIATGSDVRINRRPDHVVNRREKGRFRHDALVLVALVDFERSGRLSIPDMSSSPTADGGNMSATMLPGERQHSVRVHGIGAEPRSRLRLRRRE